MAGRPDSPPAVHGQEFTVKTEGQRVIIEAPASFSEIEFVDEEGSPLAALIEALTELTSIDAPITGDTEVTDLAGTGLAISGGALTSTADSKIGETTTLATTSAFTVNANDQRIWPFDTALVDTLGVANASSNQFDIDADGEYLVSGLLEWETEGDWATGDTYEVQVRTATQTVARWSGVKVGTAKQSFGLPAKAVRLNDGDTLDGLVVNGDGAAHNVEGISPDGETTYLSVTYLGNRT